MDGKDELTRSSNKEKKTTFNTLFRVAGSIVTAMVSLIALRCFLANVPLIDRVSAGDKSDGVSGIPFFNVKSK